MTVFFLRKLKTWAGWLTLLSVSACSSVGSGMQFGHMSGIPANRASVDAEDSSAGKASVIRNITPGLLQSEKELREKQVSQDLSTLLGKPEPYQIESGDILSIVVWDHPELSGNGNSAATPFIAANEAGNGSIPAQGFVVDHQGNIQFPYAGTLKVKGLTEELARAQLAGKLAYYFNKPNLTLRVQSYRSKRIYIDGEVKTPGMQPLNDIPMTLLEAINRAGGMLPTADQSQLFLTRAGTIYRINLMELTRRGIDPATIFMANADVLRVQSRDVNKVFIAGEVITPRSFAMQNGQFTLNDALGEAGGINPLTGDARQIYVVRKSPTEPIVYRLDAHEPGALALAEGFELQPKDVVYVAATPLANWHRTISQLFPGELTSATGAVRP